MPFACIYIPNFSVAAALRAEPELQTRPIAIFEGKPPLEKIIAVNQRAESLGITPGITKAQAELCTEIALRPRSSWQESSAHAALLDCAQSFSPCVEDSACDTVLLNLAGMESLFGTLPKISRAIADRAAALGLAARTAVASNPDAALLAARGFPGLTVIPAGTTGPRCPAWRAPQRTHVVDAVAGFHQSQRPRVVGHRGLHSLDASGESRPGCGEDRTGVRVGDRHRPQGARRVHDRSRQAARRGAACRGAERGAGTAHRAGLPRMPRPAICPEASWRAIPTCRSSRTSRRTKPASSPGARATSFAPSAKASARTARRSAR